MVELLLELVYAVSVTSGPFMVGYVVGRRNWGFAKRWGFILLAFAFIILVRENMVNALEVWYP